MSQDFISMKGKVSIELQRLGIDRKCQFDAINALNGVKKLNGVKGNQNMQCCHSVDPLEIQSLH